MKKIILAVILLLGVPSTYAAQSVMFGYGTDFDRTCGQCYDDGSDYVTGAYRYYLKKQPFKKRWPSSYNLGLSGGTVFVSPYNRWGYTDSGLFIQGNVTKWDGSNVGSDHDGTYIGAAAGYRSRGVWFPNFSRKWFLEGSVGVGHLDNPDGRHPDGKGKLTTSTQFQLTGGIGYRVTDKINIIADYKHWSNGKSLFERGSRYSPNVGRDQIGVTVEIKFGK